MEKAGHTPRAPGFLSSGSLVWSSATVRMGGAPWSTGGEQSAVSGFETTHPSPAPDQGWRAHALSQVPVPQREDPVDSYQFRGL